MKNHTITTPASKAANAPKAPRKSRTKARNGMTIAALTLALGTAVYLNWSFAQEAPLAVQSTADGGVAEVMAEAGTAPANGEGSAVAVFDELQSAEDGGSAEPAADKNYGEAQLVSVSKDSGSEFFEKARLNRAKVRDEALESIEKTLKNSALSDDEKTELTAQLKAQLSNATVESNLETLIKAKGFADCVAVVGASSVDITVMTENDALTAAEVTRIRDLVLDKCRSINAQQITVTEVK